MNTYVFFYHFEELTMIVATRIRDEAANWDFGGSKALSEARK